MSEHELAGKLHDARSACGRHNPGEVRVRIRCVRVPEVRVVEQIERLDPRLDVLTATNGEVPRHGEISSPESGSPEEALRRVAPYTRRVRRKGSRVKPRGRPGV